MLLKISFRAYNHFASVTHLCLCSGVELLTSIASEGDVKKHCSVKNYSHLNEEDYFYRFVFLSWETSSFVSSVFLNALQMMTK